MKVFVRVVLLIVLAVVMGGLWLPMFGPNLYRGIWSVSFGWLEFLKRVAPQVTVNWGGLGMVAVCSVLIVAGLNHLCAWLYRQRLGSDATGTARWRWQWSLSLYALLWLLFLAAIGVTGFVHQLGWLLTSKEPWAVQREQRGLLRMDLRYAAMELQRLGEDASWDISATQRAFIEGDIQFYRRGVVPQEELHVIFIPGLDNKLAAAVVFHRDAVRREKAGMVVVERAGQQVYEENTYADLPTVLARYGGR